MRLLFAGTPNAAVPALRALLDSSHEVVAVLTRADAPAGRGRQPTASPVKLVAAAAGLPVLTNRPHGEEFLNHLAGLRLDLAVVVAYGHILRPVVLAAIPGGWINLHFSVLPAWRGAAPVQRAIMAGEQLTGATTFLLDEGMDTGPTLGVLTEPIRPRDTAGTLMDRLAHSGAKLLLATLDGLAAGQIVPVPQPADGGSLAPKLSVAEARVRFDQPAFAVDRLIRGCTPDPGAWGELATDTARPTRLGLGPVLPQPEFPPTDLSPGELRLGKKIVLVGTATYPVALGLVQPAGKRPIPAPDWARGARLPEGARFR